MKAMILAAGKGNRMRPLTDRTPKPLLNVGGRPLIEYHLLALKEAGITEILINLGHLGRQIVQQLGSGERFGVQIHYSDETDAPLETAGGIIKALPKLGKAPFIVINGDIWTDFPLASLTLSEGMLGKIVLTQNPAHHTGGDFALSNGIVRTDGPELFTFTGIGLYHPQLFSGLPTEPLPLGPLLRSTASRKLLSGQFYPGKWYDIGTPERLEALGRELTTSS